MKAKVKYSGKLVEITKTGLDQETNKIYYNDDFGHRYYANQIEFIPKIDIDWESRRYEIAKDMMSTLAMDYDENTASPEDYARTSVKCADALVQELKKKGDESKTT